MDQNAWLEEGSHVEWKTTPILAGAPVDRPVALRAPFANIETNICSEALNGWERTSSVLTATLDVDMRAVAANNVRGPLPGQP